MAQFITQLIEKLVAAAAAALILSVILNAIPGFAAVSAGAGGFTGLFGQLSGLSGLTGGGTTTGREAYQKNATGGIFTRPHVGMFAEAGPEAIVTPEHLAQFAGVQSGGEGGFIASTKIQGSDMLLMLHRAGQSKGRTS